MRIQEIIYMTFCLHTHVLSLGRLVTNRRCDVTVYMLWVTSADASDVCDQTHLRYFLHRAGVYLSHTLHHWMSQHSSAVRGVPSVRGEDLFFCHHSQYLRFYLNTFVYIKMQKKSWKHFALNSPQYDTTLSLLAQLKMLTAHMWIILTVMSNPPMRTVQLELTEKTSDRGSDCSHNMNRLMAPSAELNESVRKDRVSS